MSLTTIFTSIRYSLIHGKAHTYFLADKTHMERMRFGFRVQPLTRNVRMQTHRIKSGGHDVFWEDEGDFTKYPGMPTQHHYCVGAVVIHGIPALTQLAL